MSIANLAVGIIRTPGKCSKGFPNVYRDQTVVNYHLAAIRDGRPEYRGPNDATPR